MKGVTRILYDGFVCSATVTEWKIFLRKEAVCFKEATTKELELKREKELWRRFTGSFVGNSNIEDNSLNRVWSSTS